MEDIVMRNRLKLAKEGWDNLLAKGASTLFNFLIKINFFFHFVRKRFKGNKFCLLDAIIKYKLLKKNYCFYFIFYFIVAMFSYLSHKSKVQQKI